MRQARSDLEHTVERARADFEHANERINARTGRNLLGAVGIAIVIGGICVLSLLFLDWAFLLFAVALAGLGVFEFGRALTVAGYRVDAIPQVLGTVAIVLSAYVFDLATRWVLTAAIIAVLIIWRMLGEMAAREHRPMRTVFGDVAVAGFLPLYVGFFASLAISLLREENGNLWLLAMAGIVVAVDTGAYAAGLAFGKHPMAPRISPKKTWEGLIGGALLAVAAGVILSLFLLDRPWWLESHSALRLSTATIGDLSESMMKRDLGIKDMSSWLPGHGGVLDRLDSMLPSVPVALGFYYLSERVFAL